MLERCWGERAHATRHEGGCMTAGDSEGQIVFSKYSQEQCRASLELAETILRFARSDRSRIVPAIPDQDYSRDVRQVISQMDPSMYDAIAAASGSNRVFLCEDHRLRWLAGQAAKVHGAWLQRALRYRAKAGIFRGASTIGLSLAWRWRATISPPLATMSFSKRRSTTIGSPMENLPTWLSFWVVRRSNYNQC